jgi:uncharacterized caspase-like protein
MRRIGLLVSLFLVLVNFGTLRPAIAESRVALVIGNAGYRHIPSLSNSAADARLMASTLKSLGFDLVGDGAQIDLDKSGLESVVRSFGSLLQGADVGLFYYAGHGIQIRGSNYLVPVGANPMREADVDFELADVAIVLRQMEASGTRLNLVMLDACRNNPFGGRTLRSVDSGLAQMRAPEGTLISFATQPGNIALDGVDGNSPYTKALARNIRRPGLGVFDVFNEVGLTVKKTTGGQQQPWVSSSPIDGSFYFAGRPEAERPPVAQTPSKQETIATASAVTSAPSPIDRQAEAAQTWTSIKDTTSQAVLEDFARKHGSTSYGPLAQARLQELKKTQVAALPPVQAAPTTTTESRKEERGVAIYNGTWTTRTTNNCLGPGTGRSKIKDGIIDGGAGRIATDGRVSGTFSTIGIDGRYSGRMTSGSYGSGTWRNAIGCRGTWTSSKNGA